MSFVRESFREPAYVWPLAIVRVLCGHMWVGTALYWLGAEDRAASLTNQVAPLLESGRSTGWYQPFIEHVVLPNAGLFAALVTAGEAFVAMSLVLGLATRLGAGVAMLLTLNYSLLYGQSFLTPAGNTLHFWMSFSFLAVAAGRAFGVDYWLHRRWAKIPLW